VTSWIEQVGAEAQEDGRVLLCMQGPARPFVAEVTGPVDAAHAVREICGRQYREQIAANHEAFMQNLAFFLKKYGDP